MKFKFWDFELRHAQSTMRVGTDSLVLSGWINLDGVQRLLDIGAGCGVLSLVAAHRYPELTVVAVESDGASAEECLTNFQESKHKDRLTCIRGDFYEEPQDERFEAIVSNPPYFTSGADAGGSRKATARHVGEKGVPGLMVRVTELLADDGAFYCVFPAMDEKYWLRSAEDVGLHPNEILRAKNEGGRFVRSFVKFTRDETEVHESILVLRDKEGRYSAQYLEEYGWMHGVSLDQSQ